MHFPFAFAEKKIKSKQISVKLTDNIPTLFDRSLEASSSNRASLNVTPSLAKICGFRDGYSSSLIAALRLLNCSLDNVSLVDLWKESKVNLNQHMGVDSFLLPVTQFSNCS